MKKLRNIFMCLVSVFFAFFLFSKDIKAKEVNVYMFYGKTCPHCEEALSYLEDIKNNYDLNIIKYEVWYNSDNQKLMDKISDYLDVNPIGVPFVIIDNTPIFGYSKGVTDDTYKYHINSAKKGNFVDKVGIKLGVVSKSNLNNKKKNNYSIDLPFVNNINFKCLSLISSSVILGIIDAICPNAIWITLFLALFLIDIKSCKKKWGLVFNFILLSAFIYMSFMTSLISFDKMINYITLARILILIFAVLIGSIKLNSFANSIQNKKENNLKIKKVFKNNKFILSLIGIIIFAFISTLIRFSYTKETSSLFMDLLSLNGLSGLVYLLYIVIYILSFIFMNLVIFLLVFILIRVLKINTKYYNYAKLISGLLIFVIGILIIIKPEWLMFY